MFMQTKRPDPELGNITEGIDAVIVVLDCEQLGSDYRLKDKVYNAVEKPLRTMMMKGGCKNAVVLFLINKYGASSSRTQRVTDLLFSDTLRKDKQSDEDFMSVVGEAANQCAVQMKWTASLVSHGGYFLWPCGVSGLPVLQCAAANCFSVKATDKETLRPAITWLCTVLAHTGPIKE